MLLQNFLWYVAIWEVQLAGPEQFVLNQRAVYSFLLQLPHPCHALIEEM